MAKAGTVGKEWVCGHSLIDPGYIGKGVPGFVVSPHGVSQEGLSQLGGGFQSLSDDIHWPPCKETLEGLRIHTGIVGPLPWPDGKCDSSIPHLRMEQDLIFTIFRSKSREIPITRQKSSLFTN